MSEAITIALIGIIPIEELEKHVNKHNQIVERTYTLERDLATYWSKYDELKERILKLESKDMIK